MMLVSVTYLHYTRDYSTQLVEHFEKHLLPETELNIKIDASNPNYCTDFTLIDIFSFTYYNVSPCAEISQIRVPFTHNKPTQN